MTEDRSFLTDGRTYLTARQAAIYLGYEPGDGPARTDRGMRSFYMFCHRHGLEGLKGGAPAKYRRVDLDRARADVPETRTRREQRLHRMRVLAFDHIAAAQ